MRHEHWLSLGLKEAARPVFEAGTLRTIEAAGTAVVGIAKHGSGHHVRGTALSNEEAVVIATILRLFNPNFHASRREYAMTAAKLRQLAQELDTRARYRNGGRTAMRDTGHLLRAPAAALNIGWRRFGSRGMDAS